ncbi:MAG: fructose-specific PTS transporter subunit EIIC [Actinomycetota bacterium]|nr:fructose-specific PTS transporter subunit EIIC [Actinomycetota bacterium]
MRIVAVTSCPTGIAHTYMAAEALEEAARDAGHTITVETQGAAGASPIPPEEIAAADVAIFAADVEVRDKQRFAGLPTVTAGVKRAINDSPGLLAQATQLLAATPVSVGGASGSGGRPAGEPASAPPAGGSATPVATRLRQWLMTGVSYMIPFVAAGGILIALSFVIGGPQIANKVNGGVFHGVTYTGVTDLSKLLAQTGYAGVLFKMGATAFSMLVPILAGFIAYAMADRPGLVPGIVAGLLASAIGAGFLGGLVGGLLAGGVVLLILKVRVPRSFRGVMPVVVVPLVSTLVVGFLMIVAIGQPIAAATSGMTHWLHSLGGSNAIVLGGLLGLMMAFDMGGPVNKVAYTFALAGLAAGDQHVMAAVIAAGMTPPVALALATVIRPRLFSPAERQAGEAAWLLGASFITEGAIPFAAADPIRVIPSLMVGSAVTGAMVMGLKASSPAPHGGIWIIGLIGKPLLFILAIVCGTVVSTACVVAAKSIHRAAPAASEATAVDDVQLPVAAGLMASAR